MDSDTNTAGIGGHSHANTRAAAVDVGKLMKNSFSENTGSLNKL
jgi:hypothetical protein